MKDVAATLRRIDEEITGHKQNIARHQVEIMRLQDTRLVLARLVEDDQHAEQAAKLDRLGVIAGEHSKPQLIVRKIGTGDEDGTASRAAKNGTPTTMHQKTKRDYKTDSAKYGKRAKVSASGSIRQKILEMMDSETPMTSREIGDFLGLSQDEDARKPMSNALYQLRVKGDLLRNEHSQYIKPAPQAQQ